MTKVGLIAGSGQLPLIWAKTAKKKGIKVYAFPLEEEDNYSLSTYVEKVLPVKVGALDHLIKTLLKYDIKKLLMLGKVEKAHIFEEEALDKRMKSLLANLKTLNDQAIFFALLKEFKQAGIEVIEQSSYMEDLLAKKGLLTKHEPDCDLWADLKYGFKIAGNLAHLDIGQTVMVKKRTIIAVEAIEGTDKTIKRAGLLAGRDVTMVKVSRPKQDFRFDIPTVGPETIANLIKIKARALAVEADRVFFLNQDKIVEQAEDAGITIMALDSQMLE